MKGYMGKLLRVNLTRGEIQAEELKPSLARDYIGGAGLGTRICYDEILPTADPLGPDNKILFMTGPITATRFPTSARYEVCTKSPLTGIWADASSSGYWGAQFKATGFDGLILEGISPRPVYLSIKDGQAELRDASQLAGKDSFETQELIQQELGDKRVRVACIGQAGEKGVLISSVMNDEGRAAGRAGVGAVMGSKRLKAIAVRGNQKIEVADEHVFNEFAKKLHTGLTQHPLAAALGAYGTATMLDQAWVTGDIPIQNWRKGYWKEGSIALGGRKMADTILKPHGACFNCPIRCARWIKIESGRYAMEGPGPEYETLTSLGTLCLNDNLEAVCYANDLCNRYGIDTISAGSVVAFAMEAYEKGALDKAETGGLDLTWGNAEAVIELVRQIGEKKGLGELLGQGVKRAAAAIGKGSEAYAVHVKGLEVPMHDPRAYYSLAVNYATSPRGACHLHGMPMMFELGAFITPEAGVTYKPGRFDKNGKGLLTKVGQDLASVVNSLVVCFFAGMGLQPLHHMVLLNSCTGLGYSSQEILQIGERISNLQRAFNLRCGITGTDDKLPPRLLEATTEGGAAGRVPDLAYQLTEYYQLRGWTPEGIPTEEKLRELGLEGVIDDLHR
ncbi:MAG: aldehyde ferredoxin oxidoreductase family protein [Nitrospinae bacterium]|nr:aldehyde ferredoxin oxidoreductase family protein [Nitrospinota bacterium]